MHLVSIALFLDHEGYAISGSSAQSIKNSFLYGNGGAYAYGDIVGTEGNLSEDPVFVDLSDDGDPTNDDLHPDTDSPLIDAGSSSSTYDDPDGSRADIGPFGGPAGDWEPAW